MRAILLASVLAIAACTSSNVTANTAAAQTAISNAQTSLAAAVQLYGVAKGIAQVASIDPAIAARVTPAIAVTDSLVASAQAALGAASVDAPAVAALVAQINAQAQSLVLTAAPAVKVISSKT